MFNLLKMNKKNIIDTILLLTGLLATGVGAFGGLPQPPKLFTDLTEKYVLLQWALVYVLVWQGSGAYDEVLSIFGTIVLYVLYNLFKKLGENQKLYNFLGLKTEAQKEEEKTK